MRSRVVVVLPSAQYSNSNADALYRRLRGRYPYATIVVLRGPVDRVRAGTIQVLRNRISMRSYSAGPAPHTAHESRFGRRVVTMMAATDSFMN